MQQKPINPREIESLDSAPKILNPLITVSYFLARDGLGYIFGAKGSKEEIIKVENMLGNYMDLPKSKFKWRTDNFATVHIASYDLLREAFKKHFYLSLLRNSVWTFEEKDDCVEATSDLEGDPDFHEAQSESFTEDFFQKYIPQGIFLNKEDHTKYGDHNYYSQLNHTI